MRNTVAGVWSLVPSLARLARGAVTQGHRRQPEKLLELYEAEYCPFCRYVRETLTELDLDVLVYPVPRRGDRFAARVRELTGNTPVPVLHDPNTGATVPDSQAIAAYLYEHYGIEGQKPRRRLLPLSVLATALRRTRGMYARPSLAPAAPLELYSFEGSPFARLVRETLCEFEIPYVLHNVGKAPGRLIEWLPPALRVRLKKDYVPETLNRRKLQQRGGRMQVPYLVDPNTGKAMYESAEIVRYLRQTYGVDAAEAHSNSERGGATA